MSKPRDYQTEAIIIKKTKLGEADRILTLYTPDLGKIQAKARGVRRPRSKLAGHLELLTHSVVSLARGRTLDTVTGSQTIDSFLNLKSDLNLTAYALYTAELVNQFTVEDVENRSLFNLLLETMEHLVQNDNKDLVLRFFELKLLNTAGYRPQLQQCVSCRQTLKPEVNYFCAGAGGVQCPDCHQIEYSRPISVNALKVLRVLQDGDWTLVARLKIDAELADELQTVMRYYLGYLLEREIKSATWLDALTNGFTLR
ncbi:MAG: DNA repair protein RecO [Chloroflexota bacterium]